MERFTGLPTVTAVTAAEKKAAGILHTAFSARFANAGRNTGAWDILLREADAFSSPDVFEVSRTGQTFTFCAAGLRGLIYAVGLFLRKTVCRGGETVLAADITGVHRPAKAVRGHQLGYRPISNTYDNWAPEDFARYSLELMFFGMNTVEHIPPRGKKTERNELMKLEEQTLLTAASADAHALGLNVSLWLPNSEDTLEEALENRTRIFEKTPYIDALFIPGSDPGELPAKELFSRGREIEKLLKQHHPNAKLYISAQAPHNAPDWGEDFLREAEKADFLDGVITGPNHAFDIETLRRRIPQNLPLRFYPDITHNLRCEYPVHFEEDDWHYAFCAALSRECVNPRPVEYAKLHRNASPYTIGSVSYSEGVNDDLNKAVWSALEWDPDTPVREILEDYARLYLPFCDAETAADALLGLERNWLGDPETNPGIEHTRAVWEDMRTPENDKNWRFLLHLFRARCDAYIGEKILFETALLRQARPLLLKGDLAGADTLLQTPLPEKTAALRKQLDADADKLFGLIGIQLSVKKHRASGWERGATLDTIDLPVTDLLWLRGQIKKASVLSSADAADAIRRALDRNKGKPDEFYFSFSLHPLALLGEKQLPEHYMNVLGDRPTYNDGSLPVCLFKLFDHFALYCRRGGFLPGTDYTLTVTYKNEPPAESARFKITANGNLIYEGPAFGGKINRAFTDELLPDGFVAVDYPLPAAVFDNGCLALALTEPTQGFQTAEFFIRRAFGSSPSD